MQKLARSVLKGFIRTASYVGSNEGLDAGVCPFRHAQNRGPRVGSRHLRPILCNHLPLPLSSRPGPHHSRPLFARRRKRRALPFDQNAGGELTKNFGI